MKANLYVRKIMEKISINKDGVNSLDKKMLGNLFKLSSRFYRYARGWRNC